VRFGLSRSAAFPHAGFVQLFGVTKAVGAGLMLLSAVAGLAAAISGDWVFSGTGFAGVVAASVPFSLARAVGQASPENAAPLRRPRAVMFLATFYLTAIACIAVTVVRPSMT
jgi:hypothetical protein